MFYIYRSSVSKIRCTTTTTTTTNTTTTIINNMLQCKREKYKPKHTPCTFLGDTVSTTSIDAHSLNGEEEEWREESKRGEEVCCA